MADLRFVWTFLTYRGRVRVSTAEMSEILSRSPWRPDVTFAGDRSPWGSLRLLAMCGSAPMRGWGKRRHSLRHPKDAFMAMPVLSATLSKASYVPGETAVLTVVYSGADTKSDVITITGTDQSGNAAQVTVVLSVVDKISLSVLDDSGRVWALQSDDGNTAVFTATI